jgi:hypothetical protein
MKGYTQFQYPGFGDGLNLRDRPDAVDPSQAIDAMNVNFTTLGAVAQRSGYAKLTAAEGTNRYDSLSAFYKADGTKQLLAGAGNRLEVLDTAGAVVASTAAPTASPHYFQRFGGPTAEHIYIANGTDTVRRWTGAAFETPAYSGTTPAGKFLALSQTDNRLVVARFPGTAAGNNPSTVRFSAEGDPLTFGTTNYVDLTPGDGESIMGVVSWRNQIIVFKQTKFFVFFGNTVDDDGEPVFNYRPVDAGVGLAASRAITVSEHGAYFLDRTGIYVTDGSDPKQLSEPIEPIFFGGPSIYYTGGVLNDASIGEATMAYHDDRLWLAFPSGTASANNRVLVHAPHYGWWTLYDIPAGPMVSFRPSNSPELVFGYASGLKHLGRHVDGLYTADNMEADGTGGVAIASRWQGGWFTFGLPAVKTIRELKIAGSGQVMVSIAHDYKQLPSFNRLANLSPAPLLYDTGLLYDDGHLYGPATLVQTKPVRRSIQGESFSLLLQNSTINRTFKVHRLTTHVHSPRVPSVIKAN